MEELTEASLSLGVELSGAQGSDGRRVQGFWCKGFRVHYEVMLKVCELRIKNCRVRGHRAEGVVVG